MAKKTSDEQGKRHFQSVFLSQEIENSDRIARIDRIALIDGITRVA